MSLSPAEQSRQASRESRKKIAEKISQQKKEEEKQAIEKMVGVFVSNCRKKIKKAEEIGDMGISADIPTEFVDTGLLTGKEVPGEKKDKFNAMLLKAAEILRADGYAVEWELGTYTKEEWRVLINPFRYKFMISW